jgi:hypothetical protein
MALAQSTDVKPPVPPTGPEPAALSPVSPATAAEKSAMSAFQTIQKANAARDVAAWEKWAAADHTIIGADGSRTSRAERVAALKAPATAPATTAAPDQQVRLVVKGDLAAITWLAGNARSLKVLALNGGQWQQVLQQSSPIVAATK